MEGTTMQIINPSQIIAENQGQLLISIWISQIIFCAFNFLYFLCLQEFKSLVSERNFFKGSMEGIVENLDLAVIVRSEQAGPKNYTNKIGHKIFKSIENHIKSKTSMFHVSEE